MKLLFGIVISSLLCASAWSAQFARPDGDFATNGWTVSGGGSLYLAIDETSPADADFIEETTPPFPGFGSAYQVTLSNVTDPVSSSDHRIRYRVRKDNNNTPIDFQIELRQGTSLIAGFIQNNVSNGFTTLTHLLSGTQANNITDYNNLRLYIYVRDPDEGESTDGEVSWAEFEVPDAPAAGAGQIIRIIIE